MFLLGQKWSWGVIVGEWGVLVGGLRQGSNVEVHKRIMTIYEVCLCKNGGAQTQRSCSHGCAELPMQVRSPFRGCYFTGRLHVKRSDAIQWVPVVFVSGALQPLGTLLGLGFTRTNTSSTDLLTSSARGDLQTNADNLVEKLPSRHSAGNAQDEHCEVRAAAALLPWL